MGGLMKLRGAAAIACIYLFRSRDVYSDEFIDKMNHHPRKCPSWVFLSKSLGMLSCA